MDVNDLKGLYTEVNKRMSGVLDHVRHELAGVRTGRASVTILDNVHVEAYGSKMPINQLAGLSVPEPTLIVAQPFDHSLMGAIEKAIRASDLGLNPANDGKVIRIPLPSLTEERRKELSRHVHKLSEEGRNGLRQVRRNPLFSGLAIAIQPIVLAARVSGERASRYAVSVAARCWDGRKVRSPRYPRMLRCPAIP